MKKYMKLLWILPVLLANDYLLPLLIRDTGSGMFILLFAMPAVCLIASVADGCVNGFRWWCPVAAAVLFVPAIFLFYNESAWVYAPAQGVISLVGYLIGWGVRRIMK